MQEPKTRTSFSYKLTPPQQALLYTILRTGNYRPVQVPHTRIAVKSEDCNINLYESGKCLVQGKGAPDFVLFILEPNVLRTAGLGYEKALNPEARQPRIGIDESGKGDFFGPIVIAAAYADEGLVDAMQKMDVKDSKDISSDARAILLGRDLRRLLGNRYSVIKIGPRKYNELYAKMRNLNTLLAWAHARALENLLEVIPDCPRAISDQFGSKQQVERALMRKGRQIELVQRHRAESDMAVAAASVIARELFLRSLKDMEKEYDQPFPKGASAAVREAAVNLAKHKGPAVLVEAAKCHFKTTDAVLTELGKDRSELGPFGQATSKQMGSFTRRRKKED